MTPLETTGLSLFTLVLCVGLFATVFSFPGTVIIAADVFLYALISGFASISFRVLLILMLLALLAETIDFALGMAGAVRIGSSEDLWAAMAGSCLGVAAMTPLLMGLGTLLGIFLGGFAGLFAREFIRRGKMKPALRPSLTSLVERVFAVVVKGGAALVMIIVVMLNVYS